MLRRYEKIYEDASLESSGKDGVQGCWIKNLSNLHEQIAIQKNKVLMGYDSLPA